jgi:hypothetical protein
MIERDNQSMPKKPLMYITQPKFDYITINMQNSAIAKQNIESKDKTKFKKIKAVSPYEIKEGGIGDTQGEKKDDNFDENNEKELNSNDIQLKRKPLKEMTVEERIQFILNKPHYIPKILCNVKTNSANFYGSIIKYDMGIVTLQQQSSLTPLNIHIEEIKSIKMSGY